MSWKQQKMISLLAIAAALVVNCLPAAPAKLPAEQRLAASP
jgi:hypothetical protein